MKNTICIDLTKYKRVELEQLEKVYNLKAGSLLENKMRAIGKVWIDLDLNILCAYVIENAMNDILISEDYINALSKIKSVELPVVKPVQVTVELDTDTILEKITASGMDSLTKDELDFLNNL